MKEMKTNYKSMGVSKGFGCKDNTQASPAKKINSDVASYDAGKGKGYTSGSKGYNSQALSNSY